MSYTCNHVKICVSNKIDEMFQFCLFSKQQRGFALMLQIAQSREREDHNIIPAAQFNVGKAYYQG